MDPRLVALALAVPAAIAGSAVVPPFAVVAALLIPVSAIAWAFLETPARWAIAMLPGALVAGLATGGLMEYAVVVLAGPIARVALDRGSSPPAAVAWGAVPFGAWTIALAITGFEPIAGEVFEALMAESVRRGDIPQEGLEELEVAWTRVLGILSRIWVASELTWLWGTLLVAYVAARRLLGGARVMPRAGRFTRFDVPDVLIWVLIAGLALVLASGSGASDVLATIGWNLVFGSGFAFLVRGIAVESFWLGRTGLRIGARWALLLGAGLLFLPAFVVTASGLGLFDAWFDFRKLRAGDGRENPLTFLGRSSPDDLNEKE